MSRVAKAPVLLPSNVDFSLEKGVFTIKGPKGKLTEHHNRLVQITQSGDVNKQLHFKPKNDTQEGWAQAGTARALVRNMIQGVTEGFQKTLELVGVGYRAQSKGKSITLSLGYSHPIEYNLPEGVTAETPSATSIVLKSMDKQLLGQVASEIRAFREPEPYKGKGVKYAGEVIARKEAKKK
ncbi:50S ribosomal protein L6 [Legionella londiniensis]|uniref:Large ribosomal subunit protein uL6 n=1 Tax=Legionella londiniensis TaxID=45068 RepID=A0A0W0VT54_9GAMM|nr:50S ribosomal protein L6 [Legionella londiniensis]KTD23292.1 50S ribosomal protein L6 [Legionella londiniensis]STX94153.1 50S ribosomal protein L6 [Legionella londiniensis]